MDSYSFLIRTLWRDCSNKRLENRPGPYFHSSIYRLDRLRPWSPTPSSCFLLRSGLRETVCGSAISQDFYSIGPKVFSFGVTRQRTKVFPYAS